MKDQIEQWEDSAERQYSDREVLVNGEQCFKCYCGRIFNPECEGGTISPNPYAMPVCGECLNEDMK